MKLILLFAVIITPFITPHVMAQSTNVVFTSVTVKDRQGKTVVVNFLEQSARKYLWEKAPETKTNKNLEVSVYVDCSKKKSSFRFNFCTEIGESQYSVTCDSAGVVTDFQIVIGDSPPRLIRSETKRIE